MQLEFNIGARKVLVKDLDLLLQVMVANVTRSGISLEEKGIEMVSLPDMSSIHAIICSNDVKDQRYCSFRESVVLGTSQTCNLVFHFPLIPSILLVER